MNNEEVTFTYSYLERKLIERREKALRFINELSKEDILRCDTGTLVVFTRYYAVSPPILRFDLMEADEEILEAVDHTFFRKTGITYHPFFIPIERDAEWLDEISDQNIHNVPLAFLDKERHRIEIRVSASPDDEEGALKRKLDYRTGLIEQFADELTKKLVDFNKDLAVAMADDLNRRKQAIIKAKRELELTALPQVYNPEHEARAIQIQNLLRRLGADMTSVNQTNQPSDREVNVFIVHGHDEVALLNLKNYIQNTLKLGEPTILREQAGLGRTIIEKFEHHAQGIEVVFVLLTPDDNATSPNDSNDEKRRARQNVIFEMGFFLGVLKRESGRILLLHKGPLEIPSDISGVEYIDISNGIESAGEKIRRELRALNIPT